MKKSLIRVLMMMFFCFLLYSCITDEDIEDADLDGNNGGSQVDEDGNENKEESDKGEIQSDDESPDNSSDNEIPDNGEQQEEDIVPEVTKVSPSNEEEGVAIDKVVIIDFNTLMDNDSISNSMEITCNEENVEVEFTFNEVGPASRVTLKTLNGFPYDCNIKILIPASVKSRKNKVMSEHFESSFKTEPDIYPPEIVSHHPESGSVSVALSVTVSVTFSEKIDTDSVSDETFYLFRIDNEEKIAGEISFENDGSKVIFQPEEKLDYETEFRMVVSKEIKDMAENKLDLDEESDDYTFNFTTTGPYILFEDFENEQSRKKWKKVNINKLMNGADPFLYSGDLWEIGIPDIEGVLKGGHSGDYLLGTVINGLLPDNKNFVNAVYYDQKFKIPENGIDMEMYAFIDTHKYPGGTRRGGVIIYLCEEIQFTDGGKCSRVSGDPAVTAELVALESDPDGYVNNFIGIYTKQYTGLSGKSEKESFVKITGNIDREESVGKEVYLVLEFNAPNDSGTSVYGVYIDDIKITEK
jgi:hypothetical protein